MSYLKHKKIGLYLVLLYSIMFTFVYSYSIEETRGFVLLCLSSIGILLSLVIHVLIFLKTDGVKKKFVGFFTVGTLSYFIGNLLWQLALQGQLFEWISELELYRVFYLVNVLCYVSAFSLLLLPIKNRFSVLYFVLDVLMAYTSVIALTWVYLLYPVVSSIDEYSLSRTLEFLINPAFQSIVLFFLISSLLIKKKFFPNSILLLYILSISIQFVADGMYSFSQLFQNTSADHYLVIAWTLALLLQGAATYLLYDETIPFTIGQNIFIYRDQSHEISRNVISALSILLLFWLYTNQSDLVIGISFIGLIAVIFTRQLLSSLQYRHMANSYQHVSKHLEQMVQFRTNELKQKNEELERTFSRLEHMAMHDQLTGLANRRYLKEKLESLVLKTSVTSFALVFIDIDEFKMINDRYGHTYGDYLLKEFSKRLKKFLPETSFIARQSGDEFVIILEGFSSKAEVNQWCESLISLQQKPYEVYDEMILLTISAGVAIYPDHAKTVHELLTVADHAMYKVKDQGKNDVHLV